MAIAISANSIKTRGISVFEESLSHEEEAFISVRGKNRFVVITVEKYEQLREAELEMALFESRHDLANGNFVQESVEDHLKRIVNG